MLPDIGAMELFLVLVVALVVVGPKELPRLLRSVAGFVRQIRGMASEFRQGFDTLAKEVAEDADPFSDLKKEEGLRPNMTPEEITEHIMANRGRGVGLGQAPEDHDESNNDDASGEATDGAGDKAQTLDSEGTLAGKQSVDEKTAAEVSPSNVEGQKP